MPLSTKPANGPTLPAGVRRVNIADIDTTSGTQKEDVTDLDSAVVEYADPPLKEGSGGRVSQTCSASGQAKGALPACTPVPQDATPETGWICTSAEEVYEAGKYAQWSANWEYIEPQTI
jgi:hypothetical protein